MKMNVLRKGNQVRKDWKQEGIQVTERERDEGGKRERESE